MRKRYCIQDAASATSRFLAVCAFLSVGISNRAFAMNHTGFYEFNVVICEINTRLNDVKSAYAHRCGKLAALRQAGFAGQADTDTGNVLREILDKPGNNNESKWLHELDQKAMDRPSLIDNLSEAIAAQLAWIETARLSLTAIAAKVHDLEQSAGKLGLEKASCRQMQRVKANDSLRNIRKIIQKLKMCGADEKDLVRILTSVDCQSALAKAEVPSPAQLIQTLQRQRVHFEKIACQLDGTRNQLISLQSHMQSLKKKTS